MGYGICLKVWGDYACFTRPEMKVERVSYDVITPSAARGLIEAIYWKPAIRWVIDRLHVINPVEFTNIRRNEVSNKIPVNNVLSIANGENKPFYMDSTEKRQQRAALVLRNVCYCIEAHFEMTEMAGDTDDEKKHYNIALRRMREGQFHHQPVMGNREFPAYFELLDNPPTSNLAGETDLGYMLYDLNFKSSGDTNINYNNAEPVFYRPKMVDGIIDVAKYFKETAGK